MSSYCNVEVKGHIFDSLTLSKIMDVILSHNADCEVEDIKIGLKKNDRSSVKIRITADSAEILSKILEKIKQHGALVINDVSSFIELRGHIVDSFTLPKILDTILDNGAKCKIENIKIGKEIDSVSSTIIKITANNLKSLHSILDKVIKEGASVIPSDITSI
ncbi:MAG: hypothetical protein PHC34_06330 [Candidatus Gastranaerophilales bacterium]|nr:hypothetical protein [Candidatus Gastranaerophilales bacterium]